ncbi:MAG: hypothetical protein DWQ31_16570 [Planctomycetota bacterium]|nr:MAG: hypothetical protein DWQ31_16570 [Planctomycetota bacterium]
MAHFEEEQFQQRKTRFSRFSTCTGCGSAFTFVGGYPQSQDRCDPPDAACASCGYVDAIYFNSRCRHQVGDLSGNDTDGGTTQILWQGSPANNAGQHVVEGFGCDLVAFRVSETTRTLTAFRRDVTTGQDGAALWTVGGLDRWKLNGDPTNYPLVDEYTGYSNLRISSVVGGLFTIVGITSLNRDTTPTVFTVRGDTSPIAAWLQVRRISDGSIVSEGFLGDPDPAQLDPGADPVADPDQWFGMFTGLEHLSIRPISGNELLLERGPSIEYRKLYNSFENGAWYVSSVPSSGVSVPVSKHAPYAFEVEPFGTPPGADGFPIGAAWGVNSSRFWSFFYDHKQPTTQPHNPAVIQLNPKNFHTRLNTFLIDESKLPANWYQRLTDRSGSGTHHSWHCEKLYALNSGSLLRWSFSEPDVFQMWPISDGPNSFRPEHHVYVVYDSLPGGNPHIPGVVTSECACPVPVLCETCAGQGCQQDGPPCFCQKVAGACVDGKCFCGGSLCENEDAPCKCESGQTGICRNGRCDCGSACESEDAEGGPCTCTDGSEGHCIDGGCIGGDGSPCDCPTEGCKGAAPGGGCPNGEGGGCQCEDGSPGLCIGGICYGDDGDDCCPGCGGTGGGPPGEDPCDGACAQCEQCDGGLPPTCEPKPSGSDCDCCGGEDCQCDGAGNCRGPCYQNDGAGCVCPNGKPGFCVNGCCSCPCLDENDCLCNDEFTNLSIQFGGVGFCSGLDCGADDENCLDENQPGFEPFKCYTVRVDFDSTYKCPQECQDTQNCDISLTVTVKGQEESCPTFDEQVKSCQGSGAALTVYKSFKLCASKDCVVVRATGTIRKNGSVCTRTKVAKFGFCF